MGERELVRGMIVGTAGHIDHGKTALVKALTGVDTDRLPEEKKRGITIDLGFAPLRLSDTVVAGVVDVPGHEAFVRTMLAGATGIDVALIVIAADEGPMPQTREHLAILELLDIRDAVVALTKADLVDADWLALVTEEVRALLRDTPFANAEIVPTSVVSGTGLSQLRSVLGSRLSALGTERRARTAENALFRLPVDRSFSVRGTGTVVTGTVWSGHLDVDAAVRILPDDIRARVRGLQNHGATVARIGPGMRAAIALAGVDQDAIARGATLVADPAWQPTLVLRADVSLLADAPELRPRTKVRLHLATADVGARVVAAGTPVAAGTSRPVRIVLDDPVVARAGDRFVLRSASPLATIGGGVVTDPLSPRRAKPMARLGLTPAERLALFVEESGAHGLSTASLPVRLAEEPAPTNAVSVEGRLYSTKTVSALSNALIDVVKAHHTARPLDPGAPRQDVRSRLGVDVPLFDHIVQDLVTNKKIEATGAELRLAGRSGALSPEQEKISQEILSALAAAGHEPPSVGELQQRFGPQTPGLLRHLERQQRVVPVEHERFYTPDAVRELLGRLEEGMAGKGELAPTDLREVLGFSRKFLIPFLEFCDRRGYTVRQGNGRVWRGRSSHAEAAAPPKHLI